MSPLSEFRAPLLSKGRRVVAFLSAQGLSMAANLIYGFLCLHMLPVSNYARYAVLFGFMGSLTVLLDVGISGTLAPLIGEDVGDRLLMANCLASLRKLAIYIYIAVMPLASAAFAALTRKQGWGWATIAEMIVALAVTAWFARVGGSYGSVLILLRDRGRYYQIQITGSLVSLGGLLLCIWFHHFNIYVAVGLNIAQVVYYGIAYYIRCMHLLGGPGTPSAELERTIVRLALPNLPSTIFYALQGQLSLLLIMVLGSGSSSIAGIGALGRIGQLFVLFSQMNPILVEPFFSRLPARRVKPLYIGSAALAGLFAALFALFAFSAPQPLLWILGPHYSNLRFEVGLAVTASSLRFLSGFVWTMNSARRFIYWWNNFATIIATIALQAFFIWKGQLGSIRGVLYLSIATAVLDVFLVCSGGVFGFLFGPQRVYRSSTE